LSTNQIEIASREPLLRIDDVSVRFGGKAHSPWRRAAKAG
jgi:hypothetical protein